MFATFTDWEFENMDGAPDTARGMWPMMQAAGATSFKATENRRKYSTNNANVVRC